MVLSVAARKYSSVAVFDIGDEEADFFVEDLLRSFIFLSTASGESKLQAVPGINDCSLRPIEDAKFKRKKAKTHQEAAPFSEVLSMSCHRISAQISLGGPHTYREHRRPPDCAGSEYMDPAGRLSGLRAVCTRFRFTAFLFGNMRRRLSHETMSAYLPEAQTVAGCEYPPPSGHSCTSDSSKPETRNSTSWSGAGMPTRQHARGIGVTDKT